MLALFFGELDSDGGGTTVLRDEWMVESLEKLERF